MSTGPALTHGGGGVPARLRLPGQCGRLGAPGGRRHRIPERMAVTSDNSMLIVADSYQRRLVAFDTSADGRLSGRRVWVDLVEGAPDGICADAQDAVWYADVPSKRCARVAEGGTVLQTVKLDRGCFASALGGPGRTTLFIVAAEWRGITEPQMVSPGSGQVIAAEVDVQGAGWP